MRVGKRSRVALIVVGILLLLCGSGLWITKGMLFEVSAFSRSGVKQHFNFGQRVQCDYQPDSQVKAYPTFMSDKPLFGRARLGGNYLDETTGHEYPFAVDESGGPGEGYDRLYFDLDRDLDLTDEKPTRPWKDAPKGALQRPGPSGRQICFLPLKVRLDDGTPRGVTLELMPLVTPWTKEAHNVFFVNTTYRAGWMMLGGRPCVVRLGQAFWITGRYDHVDATMHISHLLSARTLGTYRMTSPKAMYVINDRLTYFAVTSGGHRIRAFPYRGELGIFQMAADKRGVKRFLASGVLTSQDAVVHVGKWLDDGFPDETPLSNVPVGEYAVRHLRVLLGNIGFVVRRNPHVDGSARADRHRSAYPIKIRKGGPYSFDFSDQIKVLVLSPKERARVHVGEIVRVEAVLVDPSLEVMFDSLPRDPKVAILRADREKVAEGTMPFG